MAGDQWETQSDAIWTAYAEGFNAGRWGESKKDNPYHPADREMYRAWRRGWNEATKGNE